MHDQAPKAIATWLGTLARGGVVSDENARAGLAVAAYVVGEERLDEVRAWLRSQPDDVVMREKKAAIEVCIWMAHADRELAPEERVLLHRIVEASGLDATTYGSLLASTRDPPSLATIERRVTHPVLRELLLALSWELASADGRVTRGENDFYRGLARKLDIDLARAEEIRASIAQRVV